MSMIKNAILVAMVMVVGLFSLSPTWTVDAKEGTAPVEAEPLSYETHYAEEAKHIYLTAEPTPITKEIGGGVVFGTLQPGISITVTPVSDTYGYVKEFKGYCELAKLTKVPESDVIGVAYVLMDKSPVYYNRPNTNSNLSEIEHYTAYEIEPLEYENGFIHIGEDAFIEHKYIAIDYYEKRYYENAIAHAGVNASRGYLDRYRTSFLEREFSRDITAPSGLTADDLNALTAGTGLEGLGEEFRAIEEENGVNAVFALSVAQLESAYGQSYMARADNNIFGMGQMSFSSKSECVRYFGDLIENHYFGQGLQDVESINYVYCPPNPAWSVKVRQLMDMNFESAI